MCCISDTKGHKGLQDAKASHSICLINISRARLVIRAYVFSLLARLHLLPLIQKCLPAFPCSCCDHSASGCCEACRKDPRLHDSPMNGQQATCWGPLLSTPHAQHHVRPSSWNHSRAKTHTAHRHSCCCSCLSSLAMQGCRPRVRLHCMSRDRCVTNRIPGRIVNTIGA